MGPFVQEVIEVRRAEMLVPQTMLIQVLDYPATHDHFEGFYHDECQIQGPGPFTFILFPAFRHQCDCLRQAVCEQLEFI